jgi:hypothetical protein
MSHEPLVSLVWFGRRSSAKLPWPMTRDGAREWALRVRGKVPTDYQYDLFAKRVGHEFDSSVARIEAS